MKKHTNTFNAVSDEGVTYVIHEYTEFVDAGSFGDPNRTVEGLKELRTSNHEAVNRIKKGKYVILSPFGEIAVTSDDQNAI